MGETRYSLMMLCRRRWGTYTRASERARKKEATEDEHSVSMTVHLLVGSRAAACPSVALSVGLAWARQSSSFKARGEGQPASATLHCPVPSLLPLPLFSWAAVNAARRMRTTFFNLLAHLS